MSIAIYRNRLNDEMKRFGKFSTIIKNNLEKENILINIIFSDKKSECLKMMKNHDTIIIISHGSANDIYHRFKFDNMNHQVLIGTQQILLNDILTIDAINGKKIVAVSCGTAKNLGYIAFNNGGCKVYLGFNHKLHFDKLNKRRPSIKYHNFIISCYKDTFSMVFQKAIAEQWKFSKLKIILELELKKTVTERAQFLAENKRNYYKNHGINQAVLAISDVADNIKVFGDLSEKIS